MATQAAPAKAKSASKKKPDQKEQLGLIGEPGQNKKLEKEAPIVPIGNTAVNILEIISKAATDPNCDVDKMERLMAMQERMLDRDAESDFNISMTKAQAEMRSVVHDKKNDQTSSKYATLQAMDKAIRPIYTAAGFALSFGTDDCSIADFMRIICDVSHIGGHTKRYKVDMPLDESGIKGSVNKTKTHAHGSTMSYGQRYLTKLIFNLSTSDEDDDGNAAGTKTLEDWQVDNINTLLKDKNLDKKPFLKYIKESYNADRVADIPSVKFDEVISRISAKPNGGSK